MPIALLSPTVPPAPPVCQAPAASGQPRICAECWTITTSPLEEVWGDMVCSDCATARYDEYEAKYLPAEYDDWATVESDRMDKTSGFERIGDVLHGMGF